MLELVTHCIDVPKEVCVTSHVNPVRTKRPQVKTWCSPSNSSHETPPPDYVYLVRKEGQEGQSRFEGGTKLSVVDLDTGSIVCSAWAPSTTPRRSPQSALILNQDKETISRQFVSCGGFDAGNFRQINFTCARTNFESDMFASVAGSLNIAHGASHADAQHGWIVVGGRTRTSRPNAVFRSTVPELDFDQSPMASVFPSVDWDVDFGCVMRFSGPDDSSVLTYFTSRRHFDNEQARVKTK